MPSRGRPLGGVHDGRRRRTQRTPPASTAAAECRVGVVDHQRADEVRVAAGHADHRRLVAELGQQPVGGPFSAAPATMGETADDTLATGERAGRRARAPPAAGRSRRPGWTGRPRPSRPRRWRRAPRGRARVRRRPRTRRRLDRDGVAAADEVLLERDSSAVGAGSRRVRTGSSDMGSSRIPTPKARVNSAVTCRQRGALGQALGAVQVGGEVAVAEAEPGLAAEALERLHDLPGLAGEAPAALVVVQPGQRVGHGVEVGADVQAVEDRCRRRC